MSKEQMNDLLALLAVAQERSFTKAAAKLGLSQSGLSHKIRGLEQRMGVRLLTRTTRSVSPTEAGERLLQSVGPHFDAIEAELLQLAEYRDKPSGTIRITAVDTAANIYLWPRLSPILQDNPDLRIEIDASYRLVDIVAERYDFGVRVGDAVAKDMVAVRISPNFRRVIVGSPKYFAKHAIPLSPQDLLDHNCIMLRLSSSGGIYSWPLKKGKVEQTAKVTGQLTFNGSYQVMQAAVDGCGLAFCPDFIAQPFIDAGRLQVVMEEWAPPESGFHLYYPSRRQMSRAMTLVLDTLRVRK